MSPTRLWACLGMLLFVFMLLAPTTTQAGTMVEYKFSAGCCTGLTVGPGASFDLVVPGFITTTTTLTSWTSCTYTFLGSNSPCTDITFTPGLSLGIVSGDAVSLNSTGGSVPDIFFPLGSFGATGTYSGSSFPNEWGGNLTVSEVQAAPEPSSLLLLASGCLAAVGRFRRRGKAY